MALAWSMPTRWCTRRFRRSQLSSTLGHESATGYFNESILKHEVADAHSHRHHPPRAPRLRGGVSTGASRILSNLVQPRRRVGGVYARTTAGIGVARIRYSTNVSRREGA